MALRRAIGAIGIVRMGFIPSLLGNSKFLSLRLTTMVGTLSRATIAEPAFIPQTSKKSILRGRASFFLVAGNHCQNLPADVSTRLLHPKKTVHEPDQNTALVSL